MKHEVEQHRQQLIEKIQGELERLRARRKHLQTYTSTPQTQYDYHNIKNQSPGQVQIPGDSNVKQPQLLSQYQKANLKSQTNFLQQLYNTKKQLSSAGITSVNNPHKLMQYKTDPNLQTYLQKKKQQTKKQYQKKKILQEEMEKTHQFLKGKKITTKELSELQGMNYRELLKNKKQELREYERLLQKNCLNRVEKDDLIRLTFKFLKDWNQTVLIDYFGMFLKANPQFCCHFFITAAQINRDLSVLETEQPGHLTELEMKEFVKSIEITADHSVKNKNKFSGRKSGQNPISEKNKEIKNILLQKIDSKIKEEDNSKNNDRKEYKKIIEYLRKVFQSMDKLSEGVVERNSFISLVEKGFLSNKKENQIPDFKEIGEVMRKYTDSRLHKRNRYYEELNTKFIAFSEIEDMFKHHYLNKNLKVEKNDQKQKQFERKKLASKSQALIRESQEPAQSEVDTEQYLDTVVFLQKDGRLEEQDYKRYGWNKQEIQQNGGIQNIKNEGKQLANLKDLDRYYEQMKGKNLAEIEWGGFDHYKSDFKQLQAFIHDQQTKILSKTNNNR